ncbi:hypothetical protein JZ751_017468 [Albula glossodonta]|uniref:Uncharacterized protein n=1 Tax=Albula glossodonta TaxID=121402 RepID=A0A8T2PNI6_9TELE|nr:hypothetical protein JZ751_017468 [Albula glossodonta]
MCNKGEEERERERACDFIKEGRYQLQKPAALKVVLSDMCILAALAQQLDHIHIVRKQQWVLVLLYLICSSTVSDVQQRMSHPTHPTEAPDLVIAMTRHLLLSQQTRAKHLQIIFF